MNSWWQRIRSTASQDRTVAWLNHLNNVPDPESIEPYQSYVSVRAMSARLNNLRIGKSIYHLSIASSIKWRHEHNGLQTTANVIAPTDLRNLDGGTRDRVVALGTELLRTVPYCGELDLEAGVFSVKESDLVAPVLDFLVSLSDATGVGKTLPARIYGTLLGQAADILFGRSATSELEIALRETFRGDELKKGYRLVTDAPKGTMDLRAFKVDPNDMKLIDAAGQPLTGFNYLLLRVDAPKRRYDFDELPLISDTRRAIDEAFVAGQQNKVEQLIGQLDRICMASADLLPGDAKEYIKRVSDRFRASEGTGLMARSEGSNGLLQGIDPFPLLPEDEKRGAPDPPFPITHGKS
jgi:hypothetical protein